MRHAEDDVFDSRFEDEELQFRAFLRHCKNQHTCGCNIEECIQCRKHRLPSFEAVSLQVRELELQELVEDLTPGQQLPYPATIGEDDGG